MTQTESTTAADAITAAQVQGLHAFMASEARAAPTDTQLEAAAKPIGAAPSQRADVCWTTAETCPR